MVSSVPITDEHTEVYRDGKISLHVKNIYYIYYLLCATVPLARDTARNNIDLTLFSMKLEVSDKYYEENSNLIMYLRLTGTREGLDELDILDTRGLFKKTTFNLLEWKVSG
jgi:hypothetical protein